MFILRNRLLQATAFLLTAEGGSGGTGTQGAQGAQGQQGGGQGDGGQQGAGSQTATKPELLADRFWNPEKSQVRWEELNGEMDVLRQFKAEADVRMQGVPKEAAGYKLSLDGVEIPQGIEFKLDEADPMFTAAREWAKEAGIPQEAFHKLVGIYAKSQITSMQNFNTQVASERGKLGQAATQRVEAVETALKGRIGDRAAALAPMMVTAAAVEAFEALLRTTSAPGPGSSGQQGSKPDYSKMSPLERIHYAHEKASKKAA